MDAAQEPQHDLEDGEIEDDDDGEEEQDQCPDPVGETGGQLAKPQAEAGDAKAKDAAPDAAKLEVDETELKRGSKPHHRRRHEKSRDRKRSLEKELKSDEEKKRLLKEKLRALERQMGHPEAGSDDDDQMGILVSGASPSPSPPSSRKRRAGSDEAEFLELSPELKQRRKEARGPGGPDAMVGRRLQGGCGGGLHPDLGDEPRRIPRPAKAMAQEKSSEICKLFMLGKCPKNPMSCKFSHDADPPKIMELCKFYLFDRCAKKEKCLYLHKGFPCKYFHTGARCLDTADTCKFSHEPLTDVTRPILLKHLETAPKEILGEFPRLAREVAASLVFRTEAKNKNWFGNDDDPANRNPKSAADSFIEQASQPQSSSFMPTSGAADFPHPRPRQSRWEQQQQQQQQHHHHHHMAQDPFRTNAAPPFFANQAAIRMPLPKPSGAAMAPPRPGFQPMAAMAGGPPRAAMMGNIDPFPPNYGDPSFREDQVSDFIRSLRQNDRASGHPIDGPGPTANIESDSGGEPPFVPGVMKSTMEQDESQEDRCASTPPPEDNWYSSDEENSGGNRKEVTPAAEESSASLAKAGPDVIVPQPKAKESASTRDPRMNRQANVQAIKSPDNNEEDEKEKRILEMDLSMFGELELPSFPLKEEQEECDDSGLGLPFKAHRIWAVAKEIDASISSHSPLEYKLLPVASIKPDYSDIMMKQHIPISRVLQDPRLKRYSKKKPATVLPEPSSPPPSSRSAIESAKDQQRPTDPRRNRATAADPATGHATPVAEEQASQVYNPKNDLQPMPIMPPMQERVPDRVPDHGGPYFHADDVAGDMYNNAMGPTNDYFARNHTSGPCPPGNMPMQRADDWNMEPMRSHWGGPANPNRFNNSNGNWMPGGHPNQMMMEHSGYYDGPPLPPQGGGRMMMEACDVGGNDGAAFFGRDMHPESRGFYHNAPFHHRGAAAGPGHHRGGMGHRGRGQGPPRGPGGNRRDPRRRD